MDRRSIFICYRFNNSWNYNRIKPSSIQLQVLSTSLPRGGDLRSPLYGPGGYTSTLSKAYGASPPPSLMPKGIYLHPL